MLRNVRVASQIAFFLLFSLIFFVFASFPHPYTLPSDLFLRVNPLVALLTGIAARTIIPSVLVLGIAVAILTLIFGRFFCGFICPLGSTIDVADAFLFKKARALQRRPPQFLQRTKYLILIALIVLALFGSIFPLFMDPISLFTRIFAITVNPLLALIGMNSVVVGGPLLDAIGLEKLRLATLKTPLFYGVPFVSFLFLLVVAGSFWDRRFWCQYLCPSGAFFGLLSRFALFRRRTNTPGCNSCAACARVCPVRAIDNKKVDRTSTAECIECGLCTQIKGSCSSFRISAPKAEIIAPPDLHRRHMLFGLAGGVLLAPTFATSVINKADGRGRLIRPPGAIPEHDFLARCIACGNCMKSCPTNAIQPCSLNDGFNRLYTPKIVPRIGFCDSKCHQCGYACPTGALRRLPLEEKAWAKIGTAVIDRHRCLAWAQNKECVVCDEVCPYNAIEPMVVETTKGPFKVPVVWEDLCVGCGACENACPIFDEAAIVVSRFGENRQLAGRYLTPGQRDKMTAQRNKSDSDSSGPGPAAATTPAAAEKKTISTSSGKGKAAAPQKSTNAPSSGFSD